MNSTKANAERLFGSQASTTGARVGFALSTKDRCHLTELILPGLDCGGFDLIWCDGSTTREGRNLPGTRHFKNTVLKEISYGVTGGPDAAIQFALRRLLSLGYEFVGLVENDIRLQPGWLPAMLDCWHTAEEDGFSVGAITARTMLSRVLAYGTRYVIKWNMGAGMVLFSRPAAEAVLADYRLTSAQEVHDHFLSATGVNLSPVWELFMGQADRGLGADWRYSLSMWRRGMLSLGTVPSLAENIDLDIRVACRTDYVRLEQPQFGAHCLTLQQFRGRRPCGGRSSLPATEKPNTAAPVRSLMRQMA